MKINAIINEWNRCLKSTREQVGSCWHQGSSQILPWRCQEYRSTKDLIICYDWLKQAYGRKFSKAEPGECVLNWWTPHGTCTKESQRTGVKLGSTKNATSRLTADIFFILGIFQHSERQGHCDHRRSRQILERNSRCRAGRWPSFQESGELLH